MTYERIPFPKGQTPRQLYDCQIATARELKRIFQDLTGGSTTDLSALVADIAELRDDVNDLLAASGSGSGLTPQQNFELSLITATDEVLGSLANVYERLVTKFEKNADATILAAIDAAKANTGITTEIRVRAEEDLALAEQINTVSAALGVTNAQVVTLTSAVSDGDSALATQITALKTTVAGNSAQVQTIAESVNGIAASYAIVVTNGAVQGFVRLDGSAAGTAFTVAASKFQVAQPGVSGGTVKPVFAIQQVNGSSQIAFRGTMFADGTINSRHIKAGSVTADKINVNSLTAVSGNFGNAQVTGVLTGGPTGKLILNLTQGIIRGTA